MQTRVTHLFALVVSALLLSACGSTKKASQSGLSFKKRSQFNEIYFRAAKKKVLGNYTEAAQEFAKCLEIDPNSHAVMYQMANINMAVSNFTDAVYWAERSVETNNKFNYWYSGQLAQAYSKIASFDKSAKVFETMIAAEPDKRLNYTEAGKQYINDGNFKKSAKIMRKYVDKFGIDEESARLLEGLSVRLGKPKDAVAWMKQLADAHPNEVRFQGLLAETHLRAGQVEQAKTIYYGILTSAPENGYAHFGLADIYKKEGNVDSSFSHLKSAFSDRQTPVEMKMKVIGSFIPYIRRDKDMKAQALALSEKLTNAHFDEAKAWLVRGDILHAAQNLSKAREALKVAVDLDPSNMTAWRKILSIDDEMMHYEFLVYDSNTAIEFFPNQPFLYIINSYAHYTLLEYQEARDRAKEGLEIALLPTDRSDLLSTLGDAEYMLKNYQACFEAYEEVLEIQPSDAGALNNYAYYLSEQDTALDRALEMINKALEEESNIPTYLDTKGWVLYKLKRYEDALVYLKKAYTALPKDKEVASHYRDCLLKLGKTEEAKQITEKHGL